MPRLFVEGLKFGGVVAGCAVGAGDGESRLGERETYSRDGEGVPVTRDRLEVLHFSGGLEISLVGVMASVGVLDCFIGAGEPLLGVALCRREVDSFEGAVPASI